MRLALLSVATLAATLASATPARAGFDDFEILRSADSLARIRSPEERIGGRVDKVTVTSVEADRFHTGMLRIKATREDGLRLHMVVEPKGPATWQHLYLHDGQGGYLHVYPGRGETHDALRVLPNKRILPMTTIPRARVR